MGLIKKLQGGGGAAGLTPEMFGCTKMAVDIFQYAANVSMNQIFNHSLGCTPKVAILIANKDITTGSHIGMAIMYKLSSQNMAGCSTLYAYTTVNGGAQVGSTYMNATYTSTTVQFTTAGNAGLYFSANTEYTLITMA